MIFDLVFEVSYFIFSLIVAYRSHDAVLWTHFYLNIAWLPLIIAAFNSGFNQRPIKNPVFLRFYKKLRLAIYWVMMINHGFGSVSCLFFGIILVSSKPMPGEGGQLENIIGNVLLFFSPFMLFFAFLGFIGIRSNKPFDRLLETIA